MIDALHRILPASIARVRDAGTITADNVLKALDQQGVAFNFIRLDCDVDWELESSGLTDEEILALLHMENANHKGELVICTEACTRYGHEPFQCGAADLAKFISEYDLEMFFDGDVIILCEESRTITIFHHAGGYAHVQL